MLRSFVFLLSLFPVFTFAADKIPQVQLTSLPGESLNEHQVTFKELEGKIVILDFWASWCEPCKEALPHYNQLSEKYKSQGVVFIGINEDDSAKDRDAFLKKMKVQFPVFADDKKKMAESFKVLALPTLYVLDKKQKPVSFYRGFADKKTQALENTIQDLLKN